ncbi:MAG: AraC family transcriptional regulator [Clostridia bacterium]|nr:AraC family transcriptional regulator [Clostridia bacterium]
MPFEIVYSDKAVSHDTHTHVYYELLYVVEGSVLLTIRGREHRAEAGSLVFLNQFDEHATRLISDVYRRYYLLIPPTQLQSFRSDARLLSVFRFRRETFPYVLKTGEDQPRFDAYFDLLQQTARRRGKHMDDEVEALLTLILLGAQELRPDMFISDFGDSILPMGEILDEMDRNYASPFSLKDMAKRYHVSPGCLSAHFSRYVGMRPMQYVTLSRLTRARVLLLHTEQSILDIAGQCGYNDVSSFVRRFREEFGVTPLQFRLQQKHRPTRPTPRISDDR